jgi:predicted nucleotidyltransferase
MMLNLINKNSAKIILFLAVSPGSRYLRKEIKEKTGIFNLTLDASLRELLTFRIVKEEKRLYSLNLGNPKTDFLLKEIKERFSNLPLKIKFILLDFVYSASRLKGIEKIILFGSYAKLIYSDRSDVDIAIILDNQIKNKEKIEKKISLVAEKISKKYKIEIQEHFFILKDLKHKEDPLIKDIIKNGKEII